MQKAFTSIATRLSLLVAFCSCFLFLYYLFNEEYYLSCSNILMLAGFFIVPICIAGCFLVSNCDEKHKSKIANIFWRILFLYYGFVLVYLLFFASEFARDSYRVFGGNYLESLQQQWLYHTNLKPFHTIQLMLQAYKQNYTQLANMNLLGNLVAFMPCAFFLPKFFPSFKKPLFFTFYMALFIIIIEVLQLFSLSGAMDIDDLILNMAGCLFAFAILKLPIIQRYLKKYLNV